MLRKTVYISIGFLSGLFLSFYLASRYALAIAVLLGVLAILCLFIRLTHRRYLLLTVTSALIALTYSRLYTGVVLRPIESLDGETVLVEGVVLEATVSDSSHVIIKGAVNGKPCKVSAYISNFPGDIGDHISFEGKASAFSGGAFFDERSYYLPDGIYVSVSPESEITLETPKRATFSTILRRYSRYSADRLREHIGSDAGDLICAMATGDRSYLADDVRLAINRTGLGHVIAVSGLHVSIACTVMIFVAKLLRINRKLAVLLSGALVVAFVVFSGLKVSAVRAAIMMAVYILATLSRRRGDPLNTLSFCSLVMAVFNPYIIADASFVLSICGVYGVSVFAPFVLEGIKHRSKISDSFVVALCASLSTAPAMMLYFNELSLVAPFANFLLLPACSAILVLALIFVMLGCAPIFAIIPKVAGLMADAVIFICREVSSHRFTYLPLSFNEPIIIALVMSFVTIGIYLIPKSRKAVLMSIVLTIVIFGSTYAVQFSDAKDKTQLSVLASGDESILLLRKNEECIIIDIGGGAALADECEDICERFGVSRVTLATANKNGESAYSAYANMMPKPERLLLPDGSYIFEADIPYDYLAEVTKITFADCTLTLSSSGILIERDGKSIMVSDGTAYGADVNISVFDGVTVVNGESHTGDTIINIEL